MTDQRPQYGEYATPEEQRRLAGLPPLEAATSVTPMDASPAAPQRVQAATPPAAKPRRADRIITIALLAYGLVNVIMTGMSYLDLPTVMNQSMKILGIPGEFTNFAQGKLWGTIAAVLLVIGWVITTWLSVRRLRKAKLTWWVPLVGAAVTMVVVSICIMIPMMSDPAFIAYVGSAGG
ncbi:hypothetical protein DC31_08930 [Microbacterium sp. CH12i]|uniref:DUF6264 family protein n=1 Tax=Microbacterium sp. CH12i TaxID=1479651 RepID=UPI000461BF35|nr:DUF6264 family protein [Microbacterium sp. CH12i]KDA06522.1 hypothetical protein DC31_08930 [Microbacterium sp. CH12i]